MGEGESRASGIRAASERIAGGPPEILIQQQKKVLSRLFPRGNGQDCLSLPATHIGVEKYSLPIFSFVRHVY
jgi:hypothetical protein